MAEPIHLQLLADFFNRIGAYRTLFGTDAEWTGSE
jgi:hypothetical protein